MEENINALDEIHKGTTMGIDAINFIMDKVEDNSLKEVLEIELDDYKKIAKDIEKIYPKYNEGKPHSTSLGNKVITWYGIEIRTFNDKTNSKIAELLLQGVNMGIIEGKKILNKKKMDSKVSSIVKAYVDMQEKAVETLKKFL